VGGVWDLGAGPLSNQILPLLVGARCGCCCFKEFWHRGGSRGRWMVRMPWAQGRCQARSCCRWRVRTVVSWVVEERVEGRAQGSRA